MTERLNALIVEDSQDDVLLVLRALAKQGYEVEWERVQTGPDMRRALGERDWDVVLSDFRMPQFSAPEALKLCHEVDPDMPFIVVSGTVGEDVAVETMKSGAHDYLMKGKLARLGQAIAREVRDAETRRQHRLGVEKIKHLNLVLRAIRNVNQLIVAEKDPARLIEKTCELLVETRGYASAMCVSVGKDGKPEFVGLSAVGDERTSEMAGAIRVGGLTPCMKRSLGSVDPLVIESDAPECGGCPLNPQHFGRQRLARALIHEGRAFGVLGIALPDGFELNEEELELFGEVAGDIAFALHGIEADRQREESESRLAAITESSADAIFITDREGRYTYVNTASTELLGYTAEELLQMTIADLSTPEQLADNFKQFEELLANGRAYFELGLVRKDGTMVSVDLNGAVLPNGLICGSCRDLTERKRYQAQIAQSDRLASMGMLAAGVAHEINNPLTYILYNLESLVEDLPRLTSALRNCIGRAVDRLGHDEWERLAGSDGNLLNLVVLEDIRSRFDDALLGAHRIKKIARGLGTFSRVDKDRVVPVNLMHVIDVAAGMVFNEIKYRARLVKEYGTTATLMANDGRLSQVFLNLLVNATHAIEEGDVDGNEIRVRTWQEGDAVFAEVRDTGKGIPAEHLPRLFDPFFTTKEIGVGTGLGLSISKSIVEEYGGTIEVTSEVGVGTSFVVRLPLDTLGVANHMSRAPKASAEPTIRGRILVIDDEAGIRAAIARILKKHELVEADSGEAGMAILETDRVFDLILCDMMMPTMSGVELHEWLVGIDPELARKVVFVTGGAFTPKAREYLDRVDNLRLEKPFDVADFRRTVNEIIVADRSSNDPD